MGDLTTGRVTFLANSSGTFGTEITVSASVVGGSGSVVVTDNSVTVTGLSYTGSHTVSVVATSAVCPRVLKNTNVTVMFNIKCEWNTMQTLCLIPLIIVCFSPCTDSAHWIRGLFRSISANQCIMDCDGGSK